MSQNEALVDVTADILGMLPVAHLFITHPNPLVLYTQRSSLVTLHSQTQKNWKCWGSAAPEVPAMQCTEWPLLMGALQKRRGGKDKGPCRPALLNSRGYSEIHQHQLWLCGSEVAHEPQHFICFSFLLGDGTGNVSQRERKYIQTRYAQHGETCHQLLP